MNWNGGEGSSGTQIVECYTTGQVDAIATVSGIHGISAGGILGRAGNYVSIESSHSSCIVSGVYKIGGLCGDYVYELSIIDCFFDGSINAQETYGGIISDIRIEKCNLVNSFYNFDTVLFNNQHVVTPGALKQDLYNDWLESWDQLDINNYFEEQEGYYLVNNVDYLYKMLGFTLIPDITFRITDNIDLINHSDFYFPEMKCNLDGNEYSISNLSIQNVYHYDAGLIGYLNDGYVSGEIQSNNGQWLSCGGLVGRATSCDISNSFSTGQVSSTYSLEDNAIGGFISRATYSSITDCYSIGNVIGTSVKGFIASSSLSLIDNCFWDIEASGVTESDGRTGLTTLEMQDYMTFQNAGWDLVEETANGTDDYWDLNEEINYGYPFLTASSIVENDENINSDIHINTMKLSNYLNPFNPTTTIKFNLPVNGETNIKIYNVRGELIFSKGLTLMKGDHRFVWDGIDNSGASLPSGVYFCNVSNGDYRQNIKLMLLK